MAWRSKGRRPLLLNRVVQAFRFRFRSDTKLVLQRVGWLVGIGVAAGVGLSLWLVKYVASLLYGVQSRDPWTIVGAAASLAIVGLLAGWLPARRASRVDPTVALRTD